MGRLRVSVVKYLNAAPLVWGLLHGEQRDQFDLFFTVPAECAEALRVGTVDAGIIPAIEYQTIANLKVIPGIAIAARERVASVLLVSQVPVAEVRRVALDASSRTSAALVKILFAKLWQAQPSYQTQVPNLEAMLAAADAALLIGDPALQFLLGSPAAAAERVGRLFVYDLAEEWWRLTRQPFVFAFWAVRAEKASAEVVEALAAAKEYGLKCIDEIAAQAALALNLPAPALARYLRENVVFSFDASEREGLESFYRFAQELGLIAEVKPLEFILS